MFFAHVHRWLLITFFCELFLGSLAQVELRAEHQPNLKEELKKFIYAQQSSTLPVTAQQSKEKVSFKVETEEIKDFIRKNREKLRPFITQTLNDLALEAYPKGTLVKTGPDTYVPIEQLHKGSTVVSYDFENKKTVTGTVRACHRAFTKKLLEFKKLEADGSTVSWQMPCYGKFSSVCPNCTVSARWVPFATNEKLPFKTFKSD